MICKCMYKIICIFSLEREKESERERRERYIFHIRVHDADRLIRIWRKLEF